LLFHAIEIVIVLFRQIRDIEVCSAIQDALKGAGG
jgi:hypothetical protein